MVSAFDRVRNPQKIQEGRCSKFITEYYIPTPYTPPIHDYVARTFMLSAFCVIRVVSARVHILAAPSSRRLSSCSERLSDAQSNAYLTPLSYEYERIT